MNQLVPAEGVLAPTVECIAEALGIQHELIAPNTSLSALGRSRSPPCGCAGGSVNASMSIFRSAAPDRR
jgi:hypothetical protein